MAITDTSAGERWEYRALTNDYRCRVHDCEFERGESCGLCADEPNAPPTDDVSEESADDRELALRESEWRTDVKYLRKKGRVLIDANDANAGAKLFAEAAKLDRLAVENREKRAARAHDRMLVRHRREMAGLRASH